MYQSRTWNILGGFAFLCGIGLLLGGASIPLSYGQASRKPFPVSPVQEVALGERAVARFLEDRARSNDLELANRLSRIGHLLKKVSDRPNLPYRFILVKGDELQSWSFPGGSICMSEALAGFFATDDELAFALAHELAHIALRHHIQQRRFAEAMMAGTSMEEALLEIAASLMKDHELEADRFGALYSVRAGYAFTHSHGFLHRLAGAGGPRSDGAHPDYDIRIEALKTFRKELDLSVKAFHDGVKALDSNEPDEAVSLLKYFVAEFPNSVSGLVNLGLAHIARMRSSAGTPQGLAEVLAPLRHPGFSIRSIVDRVEMEIARDSFERAIDIQPDSSSALAGLGVVHTRLGEYAEARSRLTEANENLPDRWDVLLCLGNVEYLDRNYKEAAAYYERARGLEPESVEIKKNLALALEHTGNHEEALTLWKALESHPVMGYEARVHARDLAGRS